jgi:hypothetical protein
MTPNFNCEVLDEYLYGSLISTSNCHLDQELHLHGKVLITEVISASYRYNHKMNVKRYTRTSNMLSSSGALYIISQENT